MCLNDKKAAVIDNDSESVEVKWKELRTQIQRAEFDLRK